MAGYKETPRQKMIAMMYLVLTALLALNVSKDMLEAFLVVNESMENTIDVFENKLGNLYIEFRKTISAQTSKSWRLLGESTGSQEVVHMS